MKSDEHRGRERERKKDRDKERFVKRWRAWECKAKSQRRVQFWSVSMTTMWGSVLFVCGLEQTSDC